jgi:O-antigen/teichoic acid export membrane protein
LSENVVVFNPPAESELPSTRGITTKVVKGSLWTLVGQVLPLFTSLVSTPFIIRFLGSEAYGVLILVGLIPNYFAFADFGMGIASTKFGSEAYGQGLRKKEGEIVRTAGFIALLTSLLVAVPLFIFSHWIITTWFKVPENYQSIASFALKITSVSFVLNILLSVLNTPQLSRLRMDLNTLVNAVPKILMGIATPLVLYLGGFVVEAVWVAFFAAVLMFAGTVFFSGRLLPELYEATIDRDLFRPLLKFGSGWLIAMVAAILLLNVEKFLLARYVSVQSLAYYSVAFTFANMATMFSTAMTQSLVPAFSQLLAPEKRNEFSSLFSRCIRLNLIWILPAIMCMFVVAKPFFTIWAGAEFGTHSSLPFYFLLFGLLFNILAYIPHSTVTASGRTDALAKLYWFELILYVAVAVWLVNSYGIVGAAAAWSLRAVIDTFLVIWLAKKIVGVRFSFFNHFASLIVGVIFLLPPILWAYLYDNFSLWLIPLVLISIAAYSLLIWKTFVDSDEKRWIKAKTENLLRLKNDGKR